MDQDVNEFSVKFVFVFVQTRHFYHLLSLFTRVFYMSLTTLNVFKPFLRVFVNFKSLFAVFACLCQL